MDLSSQSPTTPNSANHSNDESNTDNENTPIPPEDTIDIDEIDSTDWERTNVESIKEIRDAQIETKVFEMHKENNEMTLSLVSKEKQLQKQVRGITSECGKLRLEVGWLERDLSQVKENGRRQVLETQAALQIQRLRIEEDTRDKVKEAKFLQKKVDQQRDEITQKLLVANSQRSGITSDLDAKIALLSEELEGMTSKIVNAGTKFNESTSEARRTASMLQDQLRAIELREGNLNENLEKSRRHLQELHQKLEKAEKESEAVKAEIKRLTEERAILRKKLEKGDMSKWMTRISNLSIEQIENALDENDETALNSNNFGLTQNIGFQLDPQTNTGFYIDLDVT